jgi:hypothetical protein
MTTAIRFTVFVPGGPPVTAVAPEESFRDSVGDTQLPSSEGSFIVKDVFETDTDDIQAITLEGARRADERRPREANMAIMYHWTAHQLARVTAGGICAQTERSPLSVDELRYCHEQIALHPNYDRHRLSSIAEDGTVVNYPELES